MKEEWRVRETNGIKSSFWPAKMFERLSTPANLCLPNRELSFEEIVKCLEIIFKRPSTRDHFSKSNWRLEIVNVNTGESIPYEILGL